MPDEALLWVALDYTGDDLVRGLVLLVAADNLDTPVLLVGSKEGEVLQDVQHYRRPQHTLDRGLDVLQLTLLLIVVVTPWPPLLDGHANGAVAEQAALGGEREDVRHEYGRHFLLVDLVDLEGTVEPDDGAARGCLGLADG